MISPKQRRKMKTIKFKNQKAYTAYKFILDTCDSNNQCAFCPFFNEEAKCVFQECSPLAWPHAELECDTCPVKNSCDEGYESMKSFIDKSVLEAENEKLKEDIANRDELISILEKQLSDASNEVAANRTEISVIKAELRRKNHYIAKLEGQIAKAKEALKND